MRRSPKEWLGVLAAFFLLVVVSPVLFLLFLLMPFRYYWDYSRSNRLRREFETRWAAQGKRGILVYSNSPHWKVYIEEKWLPAVSDYVVVMNWSEKTKWPDNRPFEAQLFRAFAGDREFNPIAIVFPQPRATLTQMLADAWRRRDWVAILFPGSPDVKVIRFWKAFRDFKHGRERALRASEQELFATLRTPPPADSHAAA